MATSTGPSLRNPFWKRTDCWGRQPRGTSRAECANHHTQSDPPWKRRDLIGFAPESNQEDLKRQHPKSLGLYGPNQRHGLVKANEPVDRTSDEAAEKQGCTRFLGVSKATGKGLAADLFLPVAPAEASYAELLQVINVPFRELMDMLADIDRVRGHWERRRMLGLCSSGAGARGRTRAPRCAATARGCEMLRATLHGASKLVR